MLLQDGKVLIAGGFNVSDTLASAEIYDPVTGLWSTTGSMTVPREIFTLSMLPSGKALAAAGNDGPTFYNTAELYDPRTGTWAPTGNLSYARAVHAATELPSGEVVVTGGESTYGAPPVDKTVEVYNPMTETWTSVGSMVAGHFYHTATRLQDGRILVVGGLHANGGRQRADELGINVP